MIQGMVGAGWAGDIAIDDVNLDNVPCVNSSYLNQSPISKHFYLSLDSKMNLVYLIYNTVQNNFRIGIN